MVRPDVYFVDQRLGRYAGGLGRLVGKLTDLANDLARQRFGQYSLENPTDISLAPVPTENDGFYVVVGYSHQTGGQANARFQVHDTMLRVSIDGENIFLACDEAKINIPLSPREAVVVDHIVHASIGLAMLDWKDSGN